MIRRFVNLVAASPTRCTYSLHRLDVSEHLFYASTAEAEAASDDEKSNGGGGGMPTRTAVLQQLPPASMSFPFHQFPPSDWRRRYQWPRNSETFTLLMGAGPGSEGRLLHVDKDAASFLLHDADDQRSSSAIPRCPEVSLGHDPIFVSVAGKEKDKLYVIDDHRSVRNPSFKVLDLNAHHRKWRPLPPPPFFSDCCAVESFAVLDDGGTISASLANAKSEEAGTHVRTYCFDTELLEWRQAGGRDLWSLSLQTFHGKAEHVPELDALVGFPRYRSCRGSHQLCAASCDDLSRNADAHLRVPTVQDVWEYLRTPEEETKVVLDARCLCTVVHRRTEWTPFRLHQLINLGGGRFCVANSFKERRSVRLRFDEMEETGPAFVVLTGVEVLRGEGGFDAVGLRMMKHKSIRYMFTHDDEIKCVL